MRTPWCILTDITRERTHGNHMSSSGGVVTHTARSPYVVDVKADRDDTEFVSIVHEGREEGAAGEDGADEARCRAGWCAHAPDFAMSVLCAAQQSRRVNNIQEQTGQAREELS